MCGDEDGMANGAEAVFCFGPLQGCFSWLRWLQKGRGLLYNGLHFQPKEET